MSTTRTTTQTAQYNQPSMSQYNAFQPMIGAGLAQYAGDPFQSTFFNTQRQMANQAAQGWASGQQQRLGWNQNAFGPMANRGAFMQSELGRTQRAAGSQQAQALNSLLVNAGQTRLRALGQMQAYNPLQIGSTQTQTMGGLGTWLPQLAGMGISAATGGMGGMGRMAGGGAAGSPGGTYGSDLSGLPMGNMQPYTGGNPFLGPTQ